MPIIASMTEVSERERSAALSIELDPAELYIAATTPKADIVKGIRSGKPVIGMTLSEATLAVHNDYPEAKVETTRQTADYDVIQWSVYHIRLKHWNPLWQASVVNGKLVTVDKLH